MSFVDWIDRHDSEDNPLIPAATVVIIRDGSDGLETLMMRRNSRLSFAEGMWVFPGGRIDDTDAEPGDDPHTIARRAAVRECKEEADLDVDPEILGHYAHWLPPVQAPKRFSTWFFIAPAPTGAVKVDDGEITEHAWWSPVAALERAHDQRIEVLPPTWITLFDLQQFDSVAATMDAVRDRGPRAYATQMVRLPGGVAAAWDGDAAYESGQHDAPGPRHRLDMSEPTWRFEFG